MATQDYSKFSKEKLEARQKSLEQMKGDDNVQKPPQVMAQLDDQIKQIKGLLKKFKSDTEKDAVKDVEAVGETIEKVAKQTSKTTTGKKTGKKIGRPKKKTYEITVDGKKFSFSDKAGKDNCQKAIALVKAQKDQQKESTKKYEAKSTSAKISNNLQTIAKQAVAKAKSRNVAPATLKKQVDAVEKAFKTLFNALETLMGAKISQAQRNAIMRILNDFEDKKTKTTRITKKEMGGKVDNWEDVDPDVLYAKGGNIRYNDGKYQVVKIWGESTSKRGAKEVIGYVDSNEEFINEIANREDADWFPEFSKSGKVISAKGQDENEVYNNEYPNEADFGDYRYHMEEKEYWMKDDSYAGGGEIKVNDKVIEKGKPQKVYEVTSKFQKEDGKTAYNVSYNGKFDGFISEDYIEKICGSTYAEGGEIIKQWNYLGLYYFQTKNGTYNVEFTDDTMTIRRDNGETVVVLRRDRNKGGMSDGETLDNFLKNFPNTYAEGGSMARGGEIVEDSDGNKYQIDEDNYSSFKDGELGYNPMSGVVMVVSEEDDDMPYINETWMKIKKVSTYAEGGEIIDTFTSIQGSRVMPNNPFTIEKENDFYVIKNSKGEVLAKDTTKEGIMNDKGMFLNLYEGGGEVQEPKNSWDWQSFL